MQRGTGKLELSVRDEQGITRVLHVDPDATIESIHDQLRELTGIPRDCQVTSAAPLELLVNCETCGRRC